jgi:hypothetical protein
MSAPNTATAADCADAIMTMRRAKNWLFVLLLLALLGQIGLFVVARFTRVNLAPVAGEATATAAAPTTGPVVAPESRPAPFHRAPLVMQYLVGGTQFMGVTLVLILAVVLLTTMLVMLVARAVGVGHLTSAFIWTIVLAAFLFPWQAFLNNQGMTGVEFKIPGVLYCYDELVTSMRDMNLPQRADSLSSFSILKWVRFVVFPLVAVIILMTVQTRSGRGIREALGEAELAPNAAPRV